MKPTITEQDFLDVLLKKKLIKDFIFVKKRQPTKNDKRTLNKFKIGIVPRIVFSHPGDFNYTHGGNKVLDFKGYEIYSSATETMVASRIDDLNARTLTGTFRQHIIIFESSHPKWDNFLKNVNINELSSLEAHEGR